MDDSVEKDWSKLTVENYEAVAIIESFSNSNGHWSEHEKNIY